MREALDLMRHHSILVTGAHGSIGSRLAETLRWNHPGPLHATDRDTMDVTDPKAVRDAFYVFQPTLVFHLAGAKHAPLGEEDPWEAAEINIGGTRNVLQAADKAWARVVTASTCKACNPETAYGATKLIAERMTLNAGGSVARFYNVRETSGNVFSIWRDLPVDVPLPVTPCSRIFMSIDEAIRLLLWTAVLTPGRYTVNGRKPESMADVAAILWPGRPTVDIPPRRGDRLEEPVMASHEAALPVTKGIVIVASPHDQAVAISQQVAA